MSPYSHSKSGTCIPDKQLKKMKRHRNQLLAGLAVCALACVALPSCDDGFPDGKVRSGNDICFGISESGVPTRGGGGERTAGQFILRGEDAADTLCVRMTVEDGILSGRAATRGVPVTSLGAYGSFRVLAYWQSGGVQNSGFYMDETAADRGGNRWATANAYYWPGADDALRFCAYAPADAGIVAPSTPETAGLEYSVPAKAGDQKDVVVATTDYMPGDSRVVVPLAFRHICTAVRFVTGTMNPGTVERIALKGIHSRGLYDMDAAPDAAWTLGYETADFVQQPGIAVGAGTPAETLLTPADSTFMMLPQDLHEDALVEVVFNDAVNGRRTLTASLSGQVWEAGKTVTYRLSISNDDDLLEFADSEIPVQDAHYVICPVHLKVGDLNRDSWEVVSDQSWVTLQPELSSFEQDGFWIENASRKPLLGGNAVGAVTVYAFLEENYPSTAPRTATLRLRYKGSPDEIEDEITITQLPPADCGAFACERLEEGIFPWGFAWEGIFEDFETSQGGAGHIPQGQEKKYIAAIRQMFDPLPDFVILTPQDGVLLRIDYSQININVSDSPDNGWKNTWDLYNYDGIGLVSSIKDFVIALGGIHVVNGTEVVIVNPTNFAALGALKKNKFTLTTDQIKDPAGGPGYITVQNVVLSEQDANWYLPAQTQYGLIADPAYPLSGTYWTSTAEISETDNTRAWMYDAGGGNTIGNRNGTYRIRAVRRR